MTVKKGQRLDVEIENIAFGGKGLARIDGFTVFVDQAVPGDRARIRVVKKRRNYAEARVEELLHGSSYRVPAPCPYTGHCGGCKWQFLDYQQQLKYKKRHVAESLAHIGGLQGVIVHDTIHSDADSCCGF